MATMAPPPKKRTVPPKKKPPLQSNGNVPSVKKKPLGTAKKSPATAKKPPARTNSKGAALTTTKKKPALVSPPPAKKQINARDIEAQKTKPVPQPRKKKAFTTEEERNDNGKKPILAVLFLGCCCVIIALVLGLVLGLKDNGDDAAVSSSGASTGPTMPNAGNDNSPSVPQPSASASNPSSSPQSSPSGSELEPSLNLPATPAPTIRAENPSPVQTPVSNPAPIDPNPADFVLLPNADTSIQNGLNTNVMNGKQDVLYIQNGELNTQDNFDSYVLLNFDLLEIPNPNRYNKARLRLHHVPLTNNQNNIQRAASTITVMRLIETRLAIETLDGNIFRPSVQQVGPSFTVDGWATIVEVDISSLVFPITDGNDLFLQLENRGSLQLRGTGDEFRSREYQDGLLGPELWLDL